ncbi:MAG: hypothetical protein C4306_08705, partial [Thermoleophilia bacterium]
MIALTTARKLVAPPARVLASGLVGARTARWPAYSRLFCVGEGAGWSVDEDAAHLAAAARENGIRKFSAEV